MITGKNGRNRKRKNRKEKHEKEHKGLSVAVYRAGTGNRRGTNEHNLSLGYLGTVYLFVLRVVLMV